MATTISAGQTTSLKIDVDGDGVIDPGDTVTTTVTINNIGIEDATGLTFAQTLSGMTLTPGSINVSPLAFDDNFNSFGNVQLVVNATTGVFANDIEFFGATIGANPVADTVIQTTGAITTAMGGAVNLGADGSFTYDAPVGFSGNDSFTYTLVDQGGQTGAGTVSFNVGPVVWFIDNSAAGSTNAGTSANPFTSIAAFNAANGGGAGKPAAGDTVYLRQGTGAYTEADGINLLDNQTLIGQGQNLVVAHPVAGATTLETGSVAQTPTIVATGAGNDGIDLASGNTIRGLDIGNTAGSGVDDNGNVGTLTISDVTISGSGQAVNIDSGGTLNVTFDSITSTSSPAHGIDLAGVSGSFTVNGGTITATGAGRRAVNFGASTSGTFDFEDLTLTATGSDGIDLGSTNTGTYRFGNFSAGTPNGGAGIQINGTSADVSFKSVSQLGGSTGIELTNTTGSFTVKGDGSGLHNTSGGQIQNGATGISMSNARNVSLNQMRLNDFSDFAIRGATVNDFSLSDTVINGVNGNSAANDEGSISFDNLTGAATFRGSNISGGFEDNIVITNNTGAMTFTMDDSATNPMVIGLNSTTAGNDGVLIETQSTASATITIANTAFTGARGDLFQGNALGVSTMNVTLRDNAFSNAHTNIVSGGGGVTLSGGAAGSNIDFDYLIEGTSGGSQTFRDAVGSAITVNFVSGGGTANGTIRNNAIGVSGTSGSGSTSGSGIAVGAAGTVAHSVTIDNNTIRGVNGYAGIDVLANGNDPDPFARAEFDATITNNIINELGGFAFAALSAQVGGAGTEDGILNLDIRGNSFNASGAPFGSNAAYFASLSANSNLNFPGYTGSANGEFSTPAGTLSSDLNAYLLGRGNSFVNGAFPFFPSLGVDASFATGTTGNAFLRAAQAPAGGGDASEAASPEAGAGADSAEPNAADQGGVGEAGDVAPFGQNPGADAALSLADLKVIADAAVTRWHEAGLSSEQISALAAMELRIADLDGLALGAATQSLLQIDADAAGFGWFVDATPLDDDEFSGAASGSRLNAVSGAAAGAMDLLTVVMHEMGHRLGLDDLDPFLNPDDLLAGLLAPGERRLPADGQAEGAEIGSIESTALLGAPVSIGTLEAGKSATITFDAVVDAQTDQIIVNPSNQGTVSGTNFVAAPTNTFVTPLDSLSLSNLLFNDVNGNGVFDSGSEAGVDGVAMTLFADTGTVAGSLDAGDAQLSTTSTSGGGFYQFTGLAPGDYIVRLDQTNFAGGGALETFLASSPGNPDPDNNVDNDDNGAVAAGHGIVSQPITLSYNNETTVVLGNDANNTLDFGVLSPIVSLTRGGVFQGAFDTIQTAMDAAQVGDDVLVDGVSYNVGPETVTVDIDDLTVSLPSPDTGVFNLDDSVTTFTLGGNGGGTVNGGVNANVIVGNDGSNRLDGGPGSDTMAGGFGNDLYYVDNSGDVIQEATGEGSADRVATNVSYVVTAGAEIELFTTKSVAGTTALELTGNAFAQTIVGNAGDNIIADGGGAGADFLRGLGGNDTYIVRNSGTTIEEKSSAGANDRVAAGVDYTLADGVFVELLTTTSTGATTGIDLTGNTGAQTIVGNAANNTISDGGGAAANGDILKGLAGSDFYIVRNEGTLVQELVGQGAFDRVAVSKSFALAAGAEVESLRTTSMHGTNAIDLTGNAFGQQIIGNAGANTLTGNGGADTFFFGSALGGGNIDTITDYDVADDQFELVQTIFNGIAATGALDADAFVANTTGNAEDATDRIIYNSDTGGVFYDPDGTGVTAATQFATVTAGLAITAADFNVI